MFFAIPLENKPTWRNPPWLTVLIIVINLVVFFGPQQQETEAQEAATAYYVDAGLPDLEFEPFLQHLQTNAFDAVPVALVQAAVTDGQADMVLEVMRLEAKFLARLRRHEIVTPQHPRFAAWQRERAAYEARVPPVFTERWAQDHRAPLTERPITWLTAAFLHADIGHLLGNMLFLFLFGFTVELAIGRSWYLGFYLAGAVGSSLLSGWAYAGHVGHGLGASGAISALMAMYAVLYRFQRINFFYAVLFYFNVVRAPAIVLLPLWVANEVGQHFWSDSNVGYMAHLGGLLTGAALMMSFRATRTAKVVAPPLTRQQLFDAEVETAQGLSLRMKLEAACAAWARAVKLCPDNQMALERYFQTAALWPDKEHFHRAAGLVFRLRASDAPALAFQHQAFKTYFDQAKPHARLKASDMVRLGTRFARAGFLDDASKLCQALCATDPNHAEAVDLMCVCANARLRAAQNEAALAWLPALQRQAPQHPTTLRLLELKAA
ncbi:MAG: rhomboid family intramembrane serine protease [Pseudomonadota bacterium]